jgi:hypothetical protein
MIIDFPPETAPRRLAQLHRFEGPSTLAALTKVKNQLAQGHTNKDLDQARVLDGVGEGEGLGAAAAGRPEPGKPPRSIEDDAGDTTVGFDVVDVGRAAPQSRFGGI